MVATASEYITVYRLPSPFLTHILVLSSNFNVYSTDGDYPKLMAEGARLGSMLSA